MTSGFRFLHSMCASWLGTFSLSSDNITASKANSKRSKNVLSLCLFAFFSVDICVIAGEALTHVLHSLRLNDKSSFDAFRATHKYLTVEKLRTQNGEKTFMTFVLSY